jgi:aromatic ring-cleaving dioxygenase
VTIPGPRLAADDAIELTELLGLLIDWIDSDHDRLPASLHRFTGNDAYDTTALRTDLARFQFLLGGDEQPYFGTADP